MADRETDKPSGEDRTHAGMEKALEMKKAAPKPDHPTDDSADKGMRKIENPEVEKITDPREIGRVSQFVKNAQARRDTED
ncbi:hypothetical protein FKB34_04210 [Glycocaulis profundi]|nr:hypothetical protein FKB34_04210 [Glycocaulis profundi]